MEICGSERKPDLEEYHQLERMKIVSNTDDVYG